MSGYPLAMGLSDKSDNTGKSISDVAVDCPHSPPFYEKNFTKNDTDIYPLPFQSSEINEI
tara:strand:+ start:715 stop:894 length:180 start_codon:yes stop_codon:yes gene_type:complete